jgi:hypothetical protein
MIIRPLGQMNDQFFLAGKGMTAVPASSSTRFNDTHLRE